jgi:putative peptide zinc metalloprotease protein
MRLQLNPDLVVHAFDGAGRVPRVVCDVPHRSGRPVRFLLPAAVVTVLQKCEPANSIAELAASMSERASGRLAQSQCAVLVETQLMPRGVVVDLDVELVANSMKRRDDYLSVKVTLFSHSVVTFLARRLLWLCSRAAVVIVIAAVLLAHLAVISFAYRENVAWLSDITVHGAAILIVLITIQVLWHEFGHATALVRYGGKNPEIGWGIYLWYSVFFTDLSEAWQMSRKERFHIDLAGMYFQSMFLGVFCLLWLETRQHIWLYAIYGTDLHLANNLNPFLRMDGYWALIDALGLTTLRDFSIARLFRNQNGTNPSFIAGLPLHTKRIAKIYVACSVIFYSVLLVILGWELCKLAFGLAGSIQSWHQITSGILARREVVRLVFTSIWHLVVFILGCLIFTRMIGRLLNAVIPEFSVSTKSLLFWKRSVSRA